jgi:hypothetical protein
MGNITIHQATGFNALSGPQQQAHRAKIGVRVRAILGQFWQDMDTHDVEKVIEVEGWMDVLENCSHSEIRFAWRDYQTDQRNRTARGRLAKPDAGALLAIIYSKRPRPKIVATQAPKPSEPTDPRCSAEAATEIMERAGYSAKRFGCDT